MGEPRETSTGRDQPQIATELGQLAIEHQEIEHKFLVAEDFDRATFRRTLEAMGPGRRVALVVRDTYFLLDGDRPLVYRHRYDEELQELTVKSLGNDAAVRLEVNLDLGHHRGDQLATTRAFLEAHGIAWQDTVHKDIEVFHFDDCEVVYYRAWTAERTLYCVEFEAVHKPSLDEAFAVLDRYQRATGFESLAREPRSLPQLIFPQVFSASGSVIPGANTP